MASKAERYLVKKGSMNNPSDAVAKAFSTMASCTSLRQLLNTMSWSWGVINRAYPLSAYCFTNQHAHCAALHTLHAIFDRKEKELKTFTTLK